MERGRLIHKRRETRLRQPEPVGLSSGAAYPNYAILLELSRSIEVILFTVYAIKQPLG